MRTFYRIFLLVISTLVLNYTFSQNLIEKSEKQIFIFGKKYYLHEVKKGQTLYSISVAYNIGTQEIILENSELANGKLKVGMEIKIPVNENSAINASNGTNNYIFHTVEKKQTLYFLCKKYNVDESELIRLNPDIKQGIKVGQILKVPKPGTQPIDLNKETNFYTVQPDETLFSLAQKFGVDISTLKAENPEIQNNNLKIGQVIKIPKNNEKAKVISNISIPNNENNSIINFDHLYFEEAGVSPCAEFKYNSNIKFKVAVLLPLFVQENYVQKNSNTYYKNSGRFYEFYNGLLLAAKKMKENDVSIEFYIKDTKTNLEATRNILSQSILKEVDLIIGPVYSDHFKLASDFARQNKINIVAPFKLAEAEVVNYNPFVFVANPSEETEIDIIAKYLASSNLRSITLIHNGTPDELSTIYEIKGRLINLSSSMNGIVFKELDYKSGGISAVEDALSVGLENIILVPSKDEVFITNIATKLNYLTNKYNISIFGMQSWEQYRNMELEYLKNLKFQYSTTSFVDKENKNVKNFDYQYLSYFKNEPTIHSYLGYDIAYYFLNELKNHGKQFQFCVSNSSEQGFNEGLRFEFNFKRSNQNGGFQNDWVRIVKINEDYNLVKVK